MISPNFDNTPCKLYNQDTGELVAVGKIDNVLAISKEEHEEYLKSEPVMTFDTGFSVTLNMPPARGDSKSMTHWFESFIIGLYMEDIIMKYCRHNSFDILKAIDDESRMFGGRIDIYKKVLLGILEQRKKYPRGRRNVHRKKYLRRTIGIRRIA